MANRSALAFPHEERSWLEGYLPPTVWTAVDRPFVTLTFATSMDSALSVAPGVQTALSGPQSKAMTHYLRSKHDAILIGVGTAIADDPSLNCRLEGVGGYGGHGLDGQPRPIIIDPYARWRLGADTKILKLAKEGRGKTPWIVTRSPPSSESASALEEVGGRYVEIDMDMKSQSHQWDWSQVLQALRELGIQSIMIEGGGTVINSLLATENATNVDSVIVTIAPIWLGQGGVIVSPPRSQMHAGLPVARLSRVQWQQLGDDVVLCGVQHA